MHMLFKGLTNLTKFRIKGLLSSRTLQRCPPLMAGAAVCGVQAEGQTLPGGGKTQRALEESLEARRFSAATLPGEQAQCRGVAAGGWH